MTHDELTLHWMNKQVWLEGSEPDVELMQAREEGRDISGLEDDFAALIAVDKDSRDSAWYWRSAELCDEVQDLPFVENYPYDEPSDLVGIQSASAMTPVPAFAGDENELLRKLHGGLLARVCGCVLGKPFEGWRKAEIQAWCEETGNWPLADYVREPSDEERTKIAAKSSRSSLGNWAKNWTREKLTYAVEDDDLNYTIAGFDIVKRYGKDFTPVDVAEYWCSNLPLFMLCTAERVAYRNFTMSIVPPDSATQRNPYREWIGAQIRADAFGYLNHGNPARAAEWAWRDASVSHIKNGIYGEMWVAAMLAIAYVERDFLRIIEGGLNYIPTKSRLHEAVMDVVRAFQSGSTYDQAVSMVHQRWDEATAHGWCHTISNAQLVAIALLYGEGDYGLTITRAVMPGFDTDCNGATAGSVWGIVNGVNKVPNYWSEPFNDTMRSHLLNWREVGISELAKQMVHLHLNLG